MSYQPKIQAAQHWDGVSDSMADRLQTALAPLGADGQPVILSVADTASKTPFDRAFHELLVTRLIQKGFGISRDPNVGLRMECDVQSVKHRERALDGAAPAWDLGAGPATDSEVIVSASVMSGDRYLARISDIYYIDDNNQGQYLVQGPTTRVMEFVDQ
jgi:hypothetical protein